MRVSTLASGEVEVGEGGVEDFCSEDELLTVVLRVVEVSDDSAGVVDCYVLEAELANIEGKIKRKSDLRTGKTDTTVVSMIVEGLGGEELSGTGDD